MQDPMSMREAAETLDGGRTRIYELIAAGWLQTFVIGGRRYVTRDSFERMIEAAQNGVDVLVPKATNAALPMSKVTRRRQ